jgi:hypothetical protein
MCRIFIGSLMGDVLIAITIIASLVTVVGLGILTRVNLTGFSNMSFVLSVGFTSWSVGYEPTALVGFTMLPTFMSFVSSTIGVICLAFTLFEFNQVFFFRPLYVTTPSIYVCWLVDAGASFSVCFLFWRINVICLLWLLVAARNANVAGFCSIQARPDRAYFDDATVKY